MAHYRSIRWSLILLPLLGLTAFAGLDYSGGTGHGAWMYDRPQQTLAHLKVYQKHVTRVAVPLRLLFVHAGTVDQVNGRGGVEVAISNAVETATLIPAPVQVFARVEVTEPVVQSTDLDWPGLAAAILGPIRNHDQLQGVLLDAETSGPGLIALTEALSAQVTNRVVSVAAGELDPAIMDSCGLVILKIFNIGGTLRTYRRAIAPRIEAFLSDISEHPTPYMIGLPAAANEGEFEEKTTADGERVRTSYEMADFLRSALRQVEQRCPLLGKNYRGLALNAYHPGDEILLPGSGARVKPSTPDDVIYRIINLPICR